MNAPAEREPISRPLAPPHTSDRVRTSRHRGRNHCCRPTAETAHCVDVVTKWQNCGSNVSVWLVRNSNGRLSYTGWTCPVHAGCVGQLRHPNGFEKKTRGAGRLSRRGLTLYREQANYTTNYYTNPQRKNNTKKGNHSMLRVLRSTGHAKQGGASPTQDPSCGGA